MVARIQPAQAFTVAFMRDGITIDREGADTPEDARDMALVIIGRFDSLQDGDLLKIIEEHPARMFPPAIGR